MTLLTSLDYPDPDVIRVGDVYYMISTTMYFMPGGEILQSKDLVHWERVTFLYDTLEDLPAHRLEAGQNIYGKGMWAASLRFHRGRFYACFVANDTHKTYLFTASQITGPWEKSTMEGFYHDPSLLFEDDRVFIASGNTQIRITELRPDLSGPLPGGLDRVVVEETGNPFLGYEGSHLYRINGKYYLFLIHSLPHRWRRVQACFVADSLDGEFRGGDVLDHDRGYGDQGVAQGGIVDSPDGRWWAVLFQDHGAVGRIPVLVALRWEKDFPVLGDLPETENQGESEVSALDPLVQSDDFRGPLGLCWQWNHAPDPTLWTLDPRDRALVLTTGSVVGTVLEARNTLTQRMQFPRCSALVTVDGSRLNEGDLAGLVALQGAYGWLALTKRGGRYGLRMVTKDGEDEIERAWVDLPGPEVRIRLDASFSSQGDTAEFWFGQGNAWTRIGPSHPLFFRLDHFTGCRFGLFAFSTIQSGGEARFRDFVYQAPPETR